MKTFRTTGLLSLSFTSLCLAISPLAAGTIAESEAECVPLEAGARLPDVTLRDLDGTPVGLGSLRDGNPLVLVFFRGSWCPLCTLALAHLQEAQSELEELGYTILAVSSENADELAKFAPVAEKDWERPEAPDDETKRQKFERERLPEKSLAYRLVSDPEGEAARAFGIAFYKDLNKTAYQRLGKVDLIQKNEGRSWLPLPSVFIVDKEGVIQFVDVNRDKDGTISKNYTRRMKARALVQAARKALRGHTSS